MTLVLPQLIVHIVTPPLNVAHVLLLLLHKSLLLLLVVVVLLLILLYEKVLVVLLFLTVELEVLRSLELRSLEMLLPVARRALGGLKEKLASRLLLLIVKLLHGSLGGELARVRSRWLKRTWVESTGVTGK